jgi:primosomal protein N' (replication factor Y)
MKRLYANVIVDITHEKLDRSFQYGIPERLRETLKPGMVVQIPFGKGDRLIKGYVIQITDQPEYAPEKIKEIREVLTDASSVESRLIALAAWMRDTYGSTMIQALKTVLPVKQKVKPKEKKSIRLLLSKEEADEKLAFYRKKNQKARARLLEALIETEEIPMELVSEKLHVTAPVVRALEEQQVAECICRTVYRNPIRESGPVDYQIRLNEAQQEVADRIMGEWDTREHPTYLIHGVTGSGKTEVYMELIAHAIRKGQQAIVLIPEIALTYQTVMRFYRRFGERISIINSRLSAGERYDQFQRAREGLIDVMIGPRSALFTPFPDLGIIIIDEEHEDTYKSETTPRYRARETAIYRAQMEGARVVLGSATPSVDAYYRAKEGEYTLFTIRERAKKSQLPKTEILDMRQELQAGNRSILSRALREQMSERLKRGEQTMLFLNRRGYAGFLSCRACGKAIKCPHCDVSLSLHKDGRLHCHYCGYEMERPLRCPSCGSEYLRSFRVGTQQVEELVQKEFPQARILRMDLDTTVKKDGHQKILETFASGDADILIGTQMIVKGHDFPKVTLVGVLAADLSLYANDYRCGERTFQLLTQAAGRAGRDELPGQVLIQTYDPENYSIQAAAAQDYEEFYRQEIIFRRLGGYPPTGGMLTIHGSAASLEHLTLAMDYLRKFLEVLTKNSQVQILGPVDEPVAKISDIYRKVLYVKYKDGQVLTKIKNKVEQYIEINEGYAAVNIMFDVG